MSLLEVTDLSVGFHMSDEQFRSEIEWAASDLQRLKTLLEGG